MFQRIFRLPKRCITGVRLRLSHSVFRFVESAGCFCELIWFVYTLWAFQDSGILLITFLCDLRWPALTGGMHVRVGRRLVLEAISYRIFREFFHVG